MYGGVPSVGVAAHEGAGGVQVKSVALVPGSHLHMGFLRRGQKAHMPCPLHSTENTRRNNGAGIWGLRLKHQHGI